MPNVIFVHGLISSGRGFKGNFFRKILPSCLTPVFVGTEEEKIEQLKNLSPEEVDLEDQLYNHQEKETKVKQKVQQMLDKLEKLQQLSSND